MSPERAATLVDLIRVAYSEGLLPDTPDADALMREIAAEYPALVEQNSWLPWPKETT